MPQKLRFESWMVHVDCYLLKACGLSHKDIDDWAYRDAYDAGKTPKTAASKALKAAKDASGM